MNKIYRNKDLGSSDLGWLKSKFHFSFANYYDPNRIHFGNLRVINDDLIEPQTGFDMHPHNDMEIISYVVAGELTHEDSMGHKRVVKRGEIQYMSAGTGVQHSEHNLGKEITRLLQIWIYPREKDLQPRYGDKLYKWEDRVNKLLHLVSEEGGAAEVQIQQDANIYATYLNAGKEVKLPLKPKRQAYIVQIEGDSILNKVNLYTGDGAEVKDEDITLKANSNSHILIIELPK